MLKVLNIYQSEVQNGKLFVKLFKRQFVTETTVRRDATFLLFQQTMTYTA